MIEEGGAPDQLFGVAGQELHATFRHDSGSDASDRKARQVLPSSGHYRPAHVHERQHRKADGSEPLMLTTGIGGAKGSKMQPDMPNQSIRELSCQWRVGDSGENLDIAAPQ